MQPLLLSFGFQMNSSLIIFDPVCVLEGEASPLQVASHSDFVFFTHPFTHPSTPCLLLGEFSPFAFRVIINRQGLTDALLLTVLWLVLSFHYSFFSWCSPLWSDDGHNGILWLPSPYFLWIFCRFLLHSYHEAYIKQLINKIFCFTLIRA